MASNFVARARNHHGKCALFRPADATADRAVERGDGRTASRSWICNRRLAADGGQVDIALDSRTLDHAFWAGRPLSGMR